MNYQQLIDVGLSEDFESFERRLVATADALGFPLISGALLRGALHEPDVQITSIGNIPMGYQQAAKDLDETRRDPVLVQLTKSSTPVLYDQQTYVAAGVGDLWEVQAPFGYRTGIAVKLHLPGGKHFFSGWIVTRPCRSRGSN